MLTKKAKLQDKHSGNRLQRRPRTALRSGTVLLIEDEEDLNKALATRLRHEGYRVYQALDGPSGLGDVVRREPDLIVLDLRLPELNGFEVLHRLRMLPATRQAPILIITGDPDPAIEERAAAWGIAKVLRKPLANGLFLKAVHDLIPREGDSD